MEAQLYPIDRYKPSAAAWERIRKDIVQLERQAFGAGAFEEEYLAMEFADPENIVLIVTGPDHHVIGFTWASPIDFIDEEREDEWSETAYVSDTVLAERYRGRGLIGPLMSALEGELRGLGYEFLERDAAVAGGYADKIGRAYGDRIVSRSEPHDSEWGPQVHFRIRL